MIKTSKPCNIGIMKTDIKKSSSKRIKELLYKRDWNQSDLARAIGVSPQSVQQWISGISSPRGKNLTKLSEVSGMPEHWFFMSDSSDAQEVIASNTTGSESSDVDYRKVKLLSLFDRFPESEQGRMLLYLFSKLSEYEQDVALQLFTEQAKQFNKIIANALNKTNKS